MKREQARTDNPKQEAGLTPSYVSVDPQADWERFKAGVKVLAGVPKVKGESAAIGEEREKRVEVK